MAIFVKKDPCINSSLDRYRSWFMLWKIFIILGWIQRLKVDRGDIFSVKGLQRKFWKNIMAVMETSLVTKALIWSRDIIYKTGRIVWDYLGWHDMAVWAKMELGLFRDNNWDNMRRKHKDDLKALCLQTENACKFKFRSWWHHNLRWQPEHLQEASLDSDNYTLSVHVHGLNSQEQSGSYSDSQLANLYQIGDKINSCG